MMPVSTRQHDNLDRLPPALPGREAPWAPRVWDWRVVAVLCGSALVALPLVYWLFGVVPFAVAGTIGAAGWLVRWVLLVGQPGGYRVPTHSALQLDAGRVVEGRIEVERTYAGAVVPAQITYSPTMQQAPAQPAQAAALALPDPAAQLVGDAEWRRWLDRAPHLLIAGRTDAGKTTLATAIVAERALAGDELVILDPHYQPGKWCGLPAIGAANDVEAILTTLPLLIREVRMRFAAFAAGTPTEAFRRLTVLIDEVPLIVGESSETNAKGQTKAIDLRWLAFGRKLGSEARKVRVSVILMTQSTLVQDIAINSQMRDNYLRIGLGDRARTLMGEASAARQRQLDALLAGQSHPAAIEWAGEYHLLDTSAVPDLAARRVQADIWTPPAALAGALPPTERITPRAAPATQPLTLTNQDRIVDWLIAHPRQPSSAIATALGIDVKVVRTEIKQLYNARRVVRYETTGTDKYEYAVNQPSINPS